MAHQKLFNLYLYGVITTGILLVLTGISQIPAYDPLIYFLLFVLLAFLAESSTTSVPVSDRAGITFGVGTAVSIAMLPIYGPLAAVVSVAVTNVGLWLLKPENRTTWKKSWVQLGFNTGMHAIAMVLAGLAFSGVQQLFGDAWWSLVLAWLAAAVVDDQLNFWLLMIILRLQHGSEFDVRQPWKEALWAIPINIVALSAGGGLISFAAQRFGWPGIAVFFVPIYLSTYAFRLYVHQMQDHLNHLEEIVAERTARLQQHADELALANKQKDTFLAVLSHDIKTSLASINVYASLMQEYPEITQDDPQIAADILQSLQLVTNLVDNIIELEHLEAGGEIRLRREQIDLGRIVHTMVGTLRIQAQNKGLELIADVPAEPLGIEADRQQVERILLNLISNAIKYTPRSGRVRVSARLEAPYAVIQVEDTGYGIPEEEIHTIFERFSRVKTLEHTAAGTGLGLAITKALVDAHHGEITVDSGEMEGTVFTVKLGALPLSL